MRPNTFVAAALFACSAAAFSGEDFDALDRASAARLSDPAAHRTPTLVALWSIDCVHCKKNLELFADLAKSDPRVKVVTVAVEPAQAALTEPLDRLAVPGKRFAYGLNDAPEALAYALDPKWRGELPRTLVFDGRGGRTAVSGVLSEASARQALGLAPR